MIALSQYIQTSTYIYHNDAKTVYFCRLQKNLKHLKQLLPFQRANQLLNRWRRRKEKR